MEVVWRQNSKAAIAWGIHAASSPAWTISPADPIVDDRIGKEQILPSSPVAVIDGVGVGRDEILDRGTIGETLGVEENDPSLARCCFTVVHQPHFSISRMVS